MSLATRDFAASAEGLAGVDLVRQLLADRPRDEQVPVATRRQWLENFADIAPPPAGVTVTPVTLGGVPALRIAPPAARGAFMHLHGGAYVLGSARTHMGLAARWAVAATATAYVVDYRLAPEHPWPAALDDALAAWSALPAPLALVGDSAGGGLALALAIRLRDAGLPLPAAIAVTSPWCDLTLAGPSYVEQAGVEIMLTRAGLAADVERYRGALPAADPRVSPLLADLAGLPPVLIQVGTAELLLSDSEALAARLSDAGVHTALERWAGMGHSWAAFPGVPEGPASIDTLGAFLRHQLTQRHLGVA